MGGNEGADWWRVSLLKERVAQLVEHLTFNQEVMGSNPIALTNKINKLRRYWFLLCAGCALEISSARGVGVKKSPNKFRWGINLPLNRCANDLDRMCQEFMQVTYYRFHQPVHL
jgi:hypothetical protein